MIAFDVTSNRKLKKLLNLNSQLRIRAAVSGFADGGLAARATGARWFGRKIGRRLVSAGMGC